MHLIEQGDEGIGHGDGAVIGIDAAYRALKANGPAGEIDLPRRELEGFREIAAGVVQQAAKRLCRVRRSGRRRDKGPPLLLIEEQPPPLLVEQGCAGFFVSVGESGNGEGPLVKVRVKLKMEKAPEGAFSVSGTRINLGCGRKDRSFCLGWICIYASSSNPASSRSAKSRYGAGCCNTIVDLRVYALRFVGGKRSIGGGSGCPRE